MLDIKYIRENLQIVEEAVKKRGAKINLEEFSQAEKRRRQLLLEIEELRHQRNRVSDEIAQKKKAGDDAAPLIENMRKVSEQVKGLERSLTGVQDTIDQFSVSIPNIPHPDVPVGMDESDNRLEKQYGAVPEFDFEIKSHWEIGEDLNILDFTRAAKITGARFPLYLGSGARLERALINFMLDIHITEHGYKETLPPFIVNRNSLVGTGQLPKFEEDLFKLDGWDYYLIPTSEVPMANIYANEILSEKDLPIKFTAYTPCFRSEAGSYGRDTKGLIRQHQFNKVELVKYTTPETSYEELELLLANAETILQRLELPYQVVTLCSGDIGFSASKTYDIEVWLPGQDKYREISSCSNCEEFQARRAGIRYKKDGHKKPLFVHTLNGSGLAVGRTFAAILENYQQPDGSVRIPEALTPYMGDKKKSAMNLDLFPEDIRSKIIPQAQGHLYYQCLGCQKKHSIEKLLYVCPECGQVLMIHTELSDEYKNLSGDTWQRIFDYRKMTKHPSLKGIYRYHEFLGAVIPLESVVYLGEGHTPMIEANQFLQQQVGGKFYFKNDGQNPSASFKDRGMASAFSSIKFFMDQGIIKDVIAVCASTGDTSAAAALYASYLTPLIKSAVLLPHRKVTPQQLSQPLGSGASVFEIPGVFDDCMKVVEHLASHYTVALLNSKNAWRILGQESYSYEIAQDFDWQLKDVAVVVPIGNAGNISAVMNGFIKFYEAGIIDTLPKVIGIQSEHADPVYRYYLEPDEARRQFMPVDVRPSVAQAAMIGNPVSMPRVVNIAKTYNQLAAKQQVFVCQVSEQDIMDWQLEANRNGHIACTQGGESLAGLVKAYQQGLITHEETAVVDSTAHAIKFSEFQNMYFEDQMPDGYEVTPKKRYMNQPGLIMPPDPDLVPSQEHRLEKEQFVGFVKSVSDQIAVHLNLKKLMNRLFHIGIALFFTLFLLMTVTCFGSNKGIKTSIKRYTIYKYHDGDVLCEPYIVKKDDWLYKIFRKKGEISEEDFPHFLDIFKALNSNISNIDSIEPGQNIMIPLKKVKKEDFNQTQPGILDIPVIEYATMPDSINLDPYIEKYRVREGDTVSQLINKEFLNKDGTISKEGIHAFKVANPHIKNIDLIYTGSYIHLPDPSIISESWFQSIFNKNDLIVRKKRVPDDSRPTVKLHRKALAPAADIKKIDQRRLLQLNRYASMIGGTLKRSGKIYFPRRDQTSYELDLEAFPIIETKDGKKILLISEGNIEKELLESMRSYWKHLRVEKVSEAIRQEMILAEQQKKLTVSGTINSALMDNHQIVKKLISYSSYEYIPEMDIPFTVNDVDLTARFGRIIRRPEQPDVLINFGDVYGFALDEIKKKEFEILLIKPTEAVYDIAQKIFTHLGFSTWENPTFKSDQGVSSIPGLYFFKSKRKLFLSFETLDYEALDHLDKENVKLVKFN